MVEYFEPRIPSYAILSHRWGKDEITYKDFLKGRGKNTAGYRKVVAFCALAKEREYRYCWVDTVCIDKRSSAELSEAINSMFYWYEESAECCAYLAGVSLGDHLGDLNSDQLDHISASCWWTRGWTLQELIAPKRVLFFDRDWKRFGKKEKNPDFRLSVPDAFVARITKITGVPLEVLHVHTELQDVEVAAKMSWLADRHVTRQEDQAYCALGLFGVNMPLLYGEGPNAFRRLQEEIIRTSNDESIFAWSVSSPSSGRALTGKNFSPLLATTPASFLATYSGNDWVRPQRPLYTATNQGLRWGLEPRSALILQAIPSDMQASAGPVGRVKDSASVIILSLAAWYQLRPVHIFLIELDCGHYERVLDVPLYTASHHPKHAYNDRPMTIYIHMHSSHSISCRKAVSEAQGLNKAAITRIVDQASQYDIDSTSSRSGFSIRFGYVGSGDIHF